jgi:cellulose synthase/poly-beta-1,6-N-acetylglucosamine synthase-like glycosyltransferase
VNIFSKSNGGKASALNYGIEKSEGEFVVCIDCDTQLHHDAIHLLVSKFNLKKIGAVAGNVKVGNELNILTKWQAIEYISSQNFDRRAFELLNSITVIPGAIGAFRKSSIIDIGKFSTDTLAEDCDIAIRLLKAGYVISYCSNAIAVTEAPENTKMFLTQRFRWTFGIAQAFWKHRSICFNPRYKFLGLIGLPNILIFQLLIPLFAPFADIFMISELLSGQSGNIFSYYITFLCFDILAALLAFSFEKENIKRLILLIPQRFIYRYLLWIVLIKALIKAIKGEFIAWGKLKRTGKLNDLKT